jgi:hypothetical protein
MQAASPDPVFYRRAQLPGTFPEMMDLEQKESIKDLSGSRFSEIYPSLQSLLTATATAIILLLPLGRKGTGKPPPQHAYLKNGYRGPIFEAVRLGYLRS